ncbi:hypothetical protein IW261DRAFT_1613316 [Armillaria novae-zelandiae]|uniref:Uncharacterized protein n=1 Tax=Armillaria novae-zelandiae TaxID=153914 RepID=A0AA39NHH7_9AGAR|nr:hypothetical protein IW261DRAFT_1613316 [Armillaria novae-zelandiae]
MAALEGPASLQWLLNPTSDLGGASPSPRHAFQFHAEPPARPGTEDDAPKRTAPSHRSNPIAHSRHALQPRDANSTSNILPPAPIYPQSVSQSNKRRFHEIDDRDCRVNSGVTDQPLKPKFYKNETGMRAPRELSLPSALGVYDKCSYAQETIPKPKRQQWDFISVYDPLPRPNEGPRDFYSSKDGGSLQCPYTFCPRSFSIFTQYDEMKSHYAEHANRNAEWEVWSRRHMELENVNGSCFSLAPKKYYTASQSEALLKPLHKNPPSAKPGAHRHPAHTNRQRPRTPQLPTKPSKRGGARTIYDVTHPSRAPPPPPPPKHNSSLQVPAERHRGGRTIYDVQYPGARRSERLAGKKIGDAQGTSKGR